MSTPHFFSLSISRKNVLLVVENEISAKEADKPLSFFAKNLVVTI